VEKQNQERHERVFEEKKNTRFTIQPQKDKRRNRFIPRKTMDIQRITERIRKGNIRRFAFRISKDL
jgi:hypothetical protein